MMSVDAWNLNSTEHKRVVEFDAVEPCVKFDAKPAGVEWAFVEQYEANIEIVEGRAVVEEYEMLAKSKLH